MIDQQVVDFHKTEPNLKEAYRFFSEEPSDINEHLPTLRSLAEECNHVTEMGTRYGVSTIALLAAQPKKLVCYDIRTRSTLDSLKRLGEDIDFVFNVESTLEADIEPTEFLFIDTYHTYDHLKQELNLHADKVSRYIAMHDTESCGLVGGHGSGAKGLKLAYEEFLAENSDWVLFKHFSNCNGLTILARCKDGFS